MMRKIPLLCAFALALSSCVDVKIASSIDKISYFSLYSYAQTSTPAKCHINAKLALLDIYAYTPYDETYIYIFDTKTLEITPLHAKKWISPPKEMLKMALLDRAKQNCFEISMPPLGTQKLDKTLKLSLLSLQILNDNELYQVQMRVFYEFFSMGNYKSKSGMIESLIPLDSLSHEVLAPTFAKASDEVLTKLFHILKSL
ncbi:hypothetical protein [Helicobacter marmotae]|nr:hypothetical protein [Helicobacter marmotae]